MRRRGRGLLQFHAMHRPENDLPRRLPGVRHTRRSVLRGQSLRFGVLRHLEPVVPRNGHRLHEGRHVPCVRPVRRMRRERATLLRGRHLQRRVLRHHVGDRQDVHRRQPTLRRRQGLHRQQRVYGVRRQWSGLLREQPLRLGARMLGGQVLHVRRARPAVLPRRRVWSRSGVQRRHVPGVRRSRPAMLRRWAMSERASLLRWDVRRVRGHRSAVLRGQCVREPGKRLLVRERRHDLPGVRRPRPALLRGGRLQRRRLLQRQPMRGERNGLRQRHVFERFVRRLRRSRRTLLLIELHVRELHVRLQHHQVRALRRHRRTLLRPLSVHQGVLPELLDVRRHRRVLRDGPGVLR